MSGTAALDGTLALSLFRTAPAAGVTWSALGGTTLTRVGDTVADALELVRTTPHVLWNGHLTVNPARVLDDDAYTVVARPDVAEDAYDLDIALDTHWDATPGGDAIHAVRRLVVPLRLARAWDGAAPLVDPGRISETMNDLLRATAGVGAVSVTGDLVEHLPEVVPAGVRTSTCRSVRPLTRRLN